MSRLQYHNNCQVSTDNNTSLAKIATLALLKLMSLHTSPYLYTIDDPVQTFGCFWCICDIAKPTNMLKKYFIFLPSTQKSMMMIVCGLKWYPDLSKYVRKLPKWVISAWEWWEQRIYLVFSDSWGGYNTNDT